MQQPWPAAAATDILDDWELVNDDGFVYKRKKRTLLVPTATSSSAPQQPDPALERKQRRERKRRALLKLRDKYLKEIRQWEHLSNILKEMEHNAQNQHLEHQRMLCTTSSGEPSIPEEHSASNSICRTVVDELLSQVESQEAIIQKVSNLCDVAEALCSSQEERLKQQFTDLPIWEPTPNELMAMLGEQ